MLLEKLSTVAISSSRGRKKVAKPISDLAVAARAAGAAALEAMDVEPTTGKKTSRRKEARKVKEPTATSKSKGILKERVATKTPKVVSTIKIVNVTRTDQRSVQNVVNMQSNSINQVVTQADVHSENSETMRKAKLYYGNSAASGHQPLHPAKTGRHYLRTRWSKNYTIHDSEPVPVSHSAEFLGTAPSGDLTSQTTLSERSDRVIFLNDAVAFESGSKFVENPSSFVDFNKNAFFTCLFSISFGIFNDLINSLYECRRSR